jgi:glutamate synthase (NADPH) small chain
MGELGGFLKYLRKEAGYRPREERLLDHRWVERQLSQKEVRAQSARCMDCGTPFCHAYGCPLGNLVPEFNELLYRGRWQEALDLLLATNRFPEFTGRICPAPCEAACVAGIHGEPVTIREIELAIVEKGYENGYLQPQWPVMRFEERVAVVGSGPAGLSVADSLNRAGYRVTVYDRNRQPGGILRYGIPDFKLEKWVIHRRIERMEQEGVVFEMGVSVGEDLSPRYLKNRYDAVCLAGGSEAPRDLVVPGRELQGIHFAMPYLVQQNRRVAGEFVEEEEITARDKRVIVIGGGDTGSDCLGTALRQGARAVYQFEILPKPPEERGQSTPWPMWPHKIRETHAHKEGGERRWGVMTKEFMGESRVEKLRCVEVDWTPSESGGSSPIERAGTEFVIEADLVLLAMGFTGPGNHRLLGEMGVALDPRGNVDRDSEQMTRVEGVFSAGDMAQGQSLVVRAIADGRKVAEGVIRYLERKRQGAAALKEKRSYS